DTASGTKTQSLETSGATLTSSGSCTDNAGNPASAGSFGLIKVDKTAPVISDGGPTTLANGNGWYKTDVTNGFSLNADISGPDAACLLAFPSNAQTKTTSGEGSALTVTSDGCTDLAGNAASGVTSAAFKVDQTNPSITNLGPTTLANGA